MRTICLCLTVLSLPSVTRGGELKAENRFTPGDSVVVVTDDADLTLHGKVVRLKWGTVFEVYKIADNHLAGYAKMDGSQQAGWIARRDVESQVEGTVRFTCPGMT